MDTSTSCCPLCHPAHAGSGTAVLADSCAGPDTPTPAPTRALTPAGSR